MKLSDTSLAALLIVRGFPLVDAQVDPRTGRVVFEIADSPEAELVRHQWINGCEERRFANEIKRLKTLIGQLRT